MGIIYILIPLALLLSGAATWGFLWAVRRDQFDDLDSAGVRLLFEEENCSSSKFGREEDDQIAHS